VNLDDPFESQSHPSISFKDAPIGTVVSGTILEMPKMVQGRDYETSDAAWWDAAKTEPKMCAVITLDVAGETKTLWATRPSALFAALTDARQQTGKAFEVGGTLAVKYTGDKPNTKNPRLNPAKQYAVKYTPPKPADHFGQVNESAPFAP
jgi:hypothetical protein